MPGMGSGSGTFCAQGRKEEFRETLIKAFPAPDSRREAAYSSANPCAFAKGSEEAMI